MKIDYKISDKFPKGAVVLCAYPDQSFFEDDVFSKCDTCHRKVVCRPYHLRRKKICFDCYFKLVEKQVVITKNVAKDVTKYFENTRQK